jgi:hypothetical protein
MEKRIFGVYPHTRETIARYAMVGCPEGWRVTFQEPTRTLEQNAKFHALCTDIARSGLKWMGKRRTSDEWKVLLVSGHSVATKEGTEMVPGLEGEFVNIRESTARMGVRRAASLIEYTLAFCAMHNVPLKDYGNQIGTGTHGPGGAPRLPGVPQAVRHLGHSSGDPSRQGEPEEEEPQGGAPALPAPSSKRVHDDPFP